MRYSFALAGLAALAAARDAAADDATTAVKPSNVSDLTNDTFDSFVKENDLVLAEFFAPWCGHCKALAPEYEEAADKIKEQGLDIKLAKIDCTVQADLCSKHGVEGYPTLKVFHKGESKPYGGQRKADPIVTYMVKQSMPALSTLTTQEEIDEFKKKDKLVVVGFVDLSDKKSETILQDLADKNRDDYTIALVTDAALAKAAGVSAPGVVVYRNFDEPTVPYTGKFNAADLLSFFKTSSVPLFGEVGPETYNGYMEANIPLAYVFASTEEERSSFATALKSVAEKYKGKINFATIDASKYGGHAGNINLKPDVFPAFAIDDIANKKKFPFADAGDAAKITAKTIGKFVADFVAGKIEASIKSEAVPEKQEEGVARVVVAHSWNQEVLNNEKDVLVEYYAPWCGHCKNLAPKYDELAAMFKDYSDKVAIVKIDATANDVNEDIQGFPTLKLFPAGKKDAIIDYSGDRSVEDLAKFITENGTHKVAPAIKDDDDLEVETKGMPSQAVAATQAVADAASKVAAVASEAVEAVVGGDDVHEEL